MRKDAVSAGKINDLMGIGANLQGALAQFNGNTRKISYLLAQASKHIENGTFSCVWITD
jgi:hypothetical protein